MNDQDHTLLWITLESTLDENTVNLIEELTQLLNESPTYVIDLAIQDLYQKTLAEGPKEGTN